jgi:hypothetical protein
MACGSRWYTPDYNMMTFDIPALCLILAYEILMSGVCNLEVTACFTSAYVVNFFIGKVQEHGK